MADYSNTVIIKRRPMTDDEEKVASTPAPVPAPKPMTVYERAKQLMLGKKVKEPTEEVDMMRKIDQMQGGK